MGLKKKNMTINKKNERIKLQLKCKFLLDKSLHLNVYANVLYESLTVLEANLFRFITSERPCFIENDFL